MFLESILFLQKLKISKTVLPCFGNSVAGHPNCMPQSRAQVGFGDLFASGRSSREGYTEIFVAHLATVSRVDLPVAKNACFAQ